MGLAQGLGHGLGALGEGGELEHAHGAVPDHGVGPDAAAKAAALQPGQVLLLENTLAMGTLKSQRRRTFFPLTSMSLTVFLL